MAFRLHCSSSAGLYLLDDRRDGLIKGELVQETYANKIYSRDVGGRKLSAIQITTAAAICTVLDLLATGQLPQSGFVRQEGIQVFLENRFGQVYAKPETRIPH